MSSDTINSTKSSDSNQQPESLKLKPLSNVHHFAFRCRDAEQTRWFYEDVLGLTLVAAVEDKRDFGEPGVEPQLFMHLFFEMPDGNYLAFFDDPDVAEEQHFMRKDSFDVHIALEAENETALIAWQKHIAQMGKTCIGPIDHGFVKSMYMYDPNGLQVEITCRVDNYSEIMGDMQSTVKNQINAWTRKTRDKKIEKFGAAKIDKRGTST